ncbi:1-acyl-sn-glycerol-3-phosphate acyltransferase [Nocardia sp. 2]|uniref:1-acyl-sn-glycerol-3-phosphate acyltransferase n=2 Tax=Nocardia acididurans TaxID=2802282 RepID=A0ABS1MF51_9NOCA|nr:1-acyl-sn-glycerol-3-phosphate acyltransferase [Nocardia acididurans]
MPSSPCDPSCVDSPREAGTLRVVARLLGVAGVLASFPLAYMATPRSRRPAVQRRYARALLSSCGIRVRVVDNRGDTAEYEGGVLVTAHHIGWTDIVALSAIGPMSFVARADLVNWPMLGDVARKVRVIPIERENLRALPAVIDTMSRRLADGETIGFFPEGTTWCGRAHGALRPALFQAAVDTATPVQPIRLRYLDRHGAVSTVPGFVGIDSLGDSIRRVLRSKDVVAELTLQPLQQPGTDRHELARRCRQALEGDRMDRAFTDVVDRADEIEAIGTGAHRQATAVVHPGQAVSR